MSGQVRHRGDEGGFTLIELLAVISILGIITFVLTESLILALKTTDGTIAQVSRSAAIQILEPYFTGDAQSAETADTAPTCGSAPAFLHLRWHEEGGGAKDVSYALVPPDASDGEQELIRWTCTGAVGPVRQILGHFSHAPGQSPMTATCDDLQCPATPGTPTTITLAIQTDPSASPPPATQLTVRRRTA